MLVMIQKQYIPLKTFQSVYRVLKAFRDHGKINELWNIRGRPPLLERHEIRKIANDCFASCNGRSLTQKFLQAECKKVLEEKNDRQDITAINVDLPSNTSIYRMVSQVKQMIPSVGTLKKPKVQTNSRFAAGTSICLAMTYI